MTQERLSVNIPSRASVNFKEQICRDIAYTSPEVHSADCRKSILSDIQIGFRVDDRNQGWYTVYKIKTLGTGCEFAMVM